MDDASRDEGTSLIPRQGGMFTDSSLNKADLATNLAIQLLADGGWSALTLRNLARTANVTPPAIAAWFPSASVMHAAIAGRYGERWIRERGRRARMRMYAFGSTQPISLPQVALSLLPATRLEEVFDLLMDVECGDEEQSEKYADLVLALTHGLVVARTAPHGAMSAERAEQVVHALLSGVR